MSFYPLWPYFVGMAALLALASMPLFSGADAPPGRTRGRFAAIDGMRGFLALAVVFHHGARYHELLTTNGWHTPSLFYEHLGVIGVSLFFCVTGFLFWGRLIHEGGRPDWLQLYIGRLFRIAPVYVLAIAILACIVAVAVASGRLMVSVPELLYQLAAWLSLGVRRFYPDLNGYPGVYLMQAGTVWSLRYEWIFYASLPLLALAPRFRFHLRASLLLLAFFLAWCAFDPAFWHTDRVAIPAFGALFAGGMIAASLHDLQLLPRPPRLVGAALVSGAIAGTFLFRDVDSVGSLLLLIAAFCLVAGGCDVLGLLTLRASRRLGDVSYGIYLLHGLVLTVIMRPLRGVALSSPEAHWCLVLLCAALAFCVALAAHVLVELPGIEAGKRVGAAVSRLRRSGSAVRM